MRNIKPSTFAKTILRIVAALYLFALLSCSEEKICKRVKQRHPECFQNVLVPIETIRYDTTYKSYPVVDTVFKMTESGTDTFIVVSEKIKTRIIKQHDTLFITQTVTPDTIIKTEIKYVQQYKNPEPDKGIWYKLTHSLTTGFNWFMVIMLIIILGAVILRIKKWLKI